MFVGPMPRIARFENGHIEASAGKPVVARAVRSLHPSLMELSGLHMSSVMARASHGQLYYGLYSYGPSIPRPITMQARVKPKVQSAIGPNQPLYHRRRQTGTVLSRVPRLHRHGSETLQRRRPMERRQPARHGSVLQRYLGFFDFFVGLAKVFGFFLF